MAYVRQAANALQILEYFARRGRPATLGEITRDLGWPRSSTFNLLGTLVATGYLYEPQARGGYYPSPRWLMLAEAVARAEPLPVQLERLARELRAESGETTVVAAPAGVSAIFVHVEESRHAVRFFAKVGDRVPIHASSVGRALLSRLEPEDRQKLYQRIEFVPYSDTTPVSPETVEAELAAAAERGYQRSNSEYVPDLAGVAMPLPHPSRRLAIVVVGPVSRSLERREETAALMRRKMQSLGNVAEHA